MEAIKAEGMGSRHPIKSPARRVLVVALAGLIHLCWTTAYGRAADKPIDRLRSEYPGAVKRLVDAYSRVSATITFGDKHVEGVENPRGFARSEYLVDIDNNLKRSVLRRYSDDSGVRKLDSEIVLVIGKTYSFEARRYLAQDDGFALSDFGDTGNRPKRDQIEQKFRMGGAKYLLAAFQAENMALSDLTNSSVFKITECRLVRDEGLEIAKVTFTNSPDHATKMRGYVELIPSRGWAMRRHELEALIPVKMPGSDKPGQLSHKLTTEVEYGDDHGGIPVPRRVTVIKDGRTHVGTVDRVEFKSPIDSREFQLSKYGLPDVSAPPEDPQRSVLVPSLLGVAAIALVSACWIMFKARKSTAEAR